MYTVPVDIYVFRLFRQSHTAYALATVLGLGATVAAFTGYPWVAVPALVGAIVAAIRGRTLMTRARRMVAGSLPH